MITYVARFRTDHCVLSYSEYLHVILLHCDVVLPKAVSKMKVVAVRVQLNAMSEVVSIATVVRL